MRRRRSLPSLLRLWGLTGLGNLAGGWVMMAIIVLASTPLLHTVVSSLEMFGALQRSADFGYVDWAGVFGVAVVGNVLGGWSWRP